MNSSIHDRITFELTTWLQSYCITSYGSGWSKDVINQCLEFVLNITHNFPFVYFYWARR